MIFDLDGLIVDSEPLHQRAVNGCLAQHRIDYAFEVDEYGKRFVGIPVRTNAKYLISRFNLPCSVEKFIEEREALFESLIGEAANLVAMPGLYPLIDALERRRMLLAVASASPRHQVITVLLGLGIADRFRVVVAGTDVKNPKPAPDAYLLAVERLEVPKESTIAIEDSATGAEAARAAGLRVIGIPNRFTQHQQLPADLILQNLEQVLDLV